MYKFAHARFPGNRFEVVVRAQHLKYLHDKFTDQGILFPIEDVVPRFELVVGKLRDVKGHGHKKSHREAFLNMWHMNERKTLELVVDFLHHVEEHTCSVGG